ncbi:MAG: hypothetical protein QOE90_2238 [Thermoplasmata archaeon]|nr:hypothetical protein [Thermoplasmata archaeon]
MSEVACAVCGMAFEEEGALELGAIRLVRGGKTFWFCSPPCEKEFLAKHDG